MRMERLQEFESLLLKYFEGTIQTDELTRLEQRMLENPALQDYYFEYLKTFIALKQIRQLDVSMDRPSCDYDKVLAALSDYEKVAPAVPPDPAPAIPLIRKVERKKTVRKVSKIPVVVAVLSAAALVCMIVYVTFVPVPRGREVATLIDQVNARWVDDVFSGQIQNRLTIGYTPLVLEKGIAKILFDSGACIVVEGPAELQLLNDDLVRLGYGQLYAKIPNEAIGFSVNTPKSKIIDLGTEFGVLTESDGTTELHVMKGKTELIPAAKGSKTAETVSQGQAKKIAGPTDQVSSIPCNKGLFVREINSRNNFVWRGRTLDLADIVGGGNGLGTGQPRCGIDWQQQTLISETDCIYTHAVPRPEHYLPVQFSPFIDGIFVPSSLGGTPLVLNSNPETLNLDDFIRQDTNGLLTLMIIFDTHDPSGYWLFASKEGSSANPDIPALTFPHAGQNGPRIVTTAVGNGADTYICNDLHETPDSVQGIEREYFCIRYLQDIRAKIGLLRFDISDLKDRDLTGAVLSLFEIIGTRNRDLIVYGLKDGDADYWQEDTLSYNTASCVLPAASGRYALNKEILEPLGSFHVTDNMDGGDPISVTRSGECVWNAPQTVARCNYPISTARSFRYYQNNTVQTKTLILGNENPGQADNPCIVMHANSGITFDLQAIQNVHGEFSIRSFTANCGLSQAGIETEVASTAPKASFYVLVDGKERFSSVDMIPRDQLQNIEVYLTPQDRYLTLVAAQGSDETINNDFCVFLKPCLNFD